MSDALTREQVETYMLSMERGRRDELLIHDATLRQRCEAGEQQWRKTNEQYEQAAKAVTRLTTQLAQMTQEATAYRISMDEAHAEAMHDKELFTDAQATNARLREVLKKLLVQAEDCTFEDGGKRHVSCYGYVDLKKMSHAISGAHQALASAAEGEDEDGCVIALRQDYLTDEAEEVMMGEANFSWALSLVCAGKKMARRGWNGKAMFIFLVPGSTFQVNRAPLLGIYSEGTVVSYQPHLDMKTVDGTVVPWSASQSDLLAKDWEEVA